MALGLRLQSVLRRSSMADYQVVRTAAFSTLIPGVQRAAGRRERRLQPVRYTDNFRAVRLVSFVYECTTVTLQTLQPFCHHQHTQAALRRAAAKSDAMSDTKVMYGFKSFEDSRAEVERYTDVPALGLRPRDDAGGCDQSVGREVAIGEGDACACLADAPDLQGEFVERGFVQLQHIISTETAAALTAALEDVLMGKCDTGK
jgi:hypothetical protein